MYSNSKIKAIFAFTFFIITFLLLCKAFFLTYLPDFSNYYYGAKHIVLNENPYINDSQYYTDQSYPPFTLVLFIPMTLMTFYTAELVWTVFSIVSLFACLWLIYKMHNESFFSSMNLFLSSLVFLSFPVKFSLGMGQINILVLLLLVIAVYFLSKKKFDTSGFFLGLSLAIKFFPLLLLPYFIYLKNLKIIRSLVLVLGLVICVTYIFFSFQAVNQYFTHILPDLLTSWKGDYYNQSVTGFVMRITHDTSTKFFLRSLITGILFFGLIFVFFREKRNTQELVNLKISAIIILSLLVNSFSWQHHYIWLFLPFFLLFFFIKKFGRSKKYYILLGISYLLVSLNIKDPAMFPILFQSHVFYGGLLLYSINLFLIYKFQFLFRKKK